MSLCLLGKIIQMKRILIIGSGGAGKSTLSNRLGEILKIDVIHLDTHHWLPGWKERPLNLWREKVRELAAGDEWIMDGDFRGTLDIRMERADTIIYLDMHPLVCTFRIFKRLLKYRGRTRPDLPEGCPESFDWEFSQWVMTYRKRNRKAVIAELSNAKANGISVHIFKNRNEVSSFLSNINPAGK
jgi:adenylate kinase family enzyme